MSATLTTADIVAFVARRLASLRNHADKLLAESLLQPGSFDAYHRATHISALVESCQETHILATLVAAYSSFQEAEAIDADIDATVSRLIEQATAARLSSIPKVAA